MDTGGSIYQSRLKAFNDGLNNTTQAIHQYAAAFQDGQRIAKDKTKTAAEKAEAQRQALLTQVSGFGSGIEGFANSYTNGIDHLNEVRHGFVQRNYVAKSGKLIAQQIQNLRGPPQDAEAALDPRLAAANALEKGDEVEDGEAHVVGAEGGVLKEEAHGGAGAVGLADEGAEGVADAGRAARGGAIEGFPVFNRRAALKGMGYDGADADQFINRLYNPTPGDPDPKGAAADVVKGAEPEPVAGAAKPVAGAEPEPEEGAARPVAAEALGEEGDVTLGEEEKAVGKSAEGAAEGAAKGLGEGAKIAEGLDDALPEVDEIAATTAEVPFVGEAVGALGGLVQLGSAIASAFGGGEGSSKPAAPKEDTADDGEVQNFSAGQIGGDFSVSASGR